MSLVIFAGVVSSEGALRNRYSFTTNANDSAGVAHGALVGGATLSAGAVVLNGSSAYVNLPNNLVTGLTSITIEAWLTDNNSGGWARLFDFGNSSAGEDAAGTGTQYMFLSTRSGGGVLRGAYTTTGGGAGEQIIQWSSALPSGVQKHVVWTTDGTTQLGRLYVDGVLVGSNPAMTITPAALGNTVNNWIGRAQFSADPFLNASITEFRIYDGALTGEEIQQNFALGPETAAQAGPVSILTQPQSQSVFENKPVTFSVQYRGSYPIGRQWFRGSAPIPNATNDSYTIDSALLSDNNATFSVVLTNSFTNTAFAVTSSVVTLTVNADTTAPSLVRAASLFPNYVVVSFSESVRADTATNVANYAITNASGALTILSASLATGSSNVFLATAPQTAGTAYTLIVSGVRDRAATANLIAPNSQASFIASDFAATNIGATASGTLTSVAGGHDFTSGGSSINSTNDQFGFATQTIYGDFDLQVRVNALQLSSDWARAGLMARESFATNARFAAVFTTPGAAGSFFSARISVSNAATMSGSFPANYPDTWLRLRRAGDVFDGFASLDGQTWEFLGGARIVMPALIPVGFAVSSGSTNQTAVAQFRNVALGSGTLETNAALPFEPLGPSSRRTGLVITEFMYNPPSAWGGTNNLEFVELYNSGIITEDLTGHRFTGDISFHFPSNTLLRPGQFLVVARDPIAAQAFYGVPFLGPYTNTLANDSGTLRLVNELGARILEVEYDDDAPWPVAADGTGHSLVLNRPSYGENDARAWSVSDVFGGSPGRAEHWSADVGRSVVINEFLANTDLPAVDFIELFNTSTVPVNLSGAWLSDEAGTNKFRLPDGTVINGRSAIAIDQTQLGFALSASGEKILLVNSNNTRVLDALSFGAQANGVARGRLPDGSPLWHELATPTFGTTNAAPLQRPVVFSEIMYNPISGSDEDEFVELHNRGAGPVSLAGWQIGGGVRFLFPSGASIPAGGYVVVAENLTNLLAKYPHLNVANCFGNYDGALANSGERLTLLIPESSLTTNGFVSTNTDYIVVNEVTYGDGGRWGQWSDAGGSSLELIDLRADNRFAANWADSDESAKAAWTTFDVTNILENGQTAAMINQGGYYGPPTRLEFYLEGEGEVLIDDLEFRNNSSGNLIANGDFSAGLNGFTAGGTMRKSFAESAALHLVATERGDAGPNKIWAPFTSAIVTNPPNTGTIRAKVRWLKGSPYILFRTRGHWMEVAQRLSVPTNLGTPGLPNSRAVANAGPVITDVAHAPVLPAAGQPVVVTARVIDPDSLATVWLIYRVDPSPGFTYLTMNDNGSGADAIASDGIFSAAIPAQTANTLAAFYVGAVDAAIERGTNYFPSGSPARELHVRWGESVVPGSLTTYRLWLTASNIATWTTREKNANDPFDATFVYGNSRVIYNARTLYSGSPFHVPKYDGPLGSFASDYEVNFDSDDLLLGEEDFVLAANDANSSDFFFPEKSAQVDITGNWIARKLGQPFNHRRHMHMIVNGQRRGTVYEDVQQPNRDWIEQHFPDDSEGELRKTEDWFEFADDAITQGITTATLERFNRSAGGIDTKRYRFTWRPRATDNPNDWFAFTNLILAVNDTGNANYVNRVRTWMDVPNFLRPIVVHHIAGDWDSYGYERGKNMYAYKPVNDGWRLLMWDVELGLGGANSRPATDSIYSIHDPVLRFMITNTPAFHREYLAAYLEAANIALNGQANTQLDERYAALLQNNVNAGSPDFIKTYLAARRSYLLSQLPTASVTLATNFISLTASNLVTLTGTAPLNVNEISVNGIAYPITWTSVTGWTVRVPIDAGTNSLNVVLTDRFNNFVGGTNVTAVYEGVAAPLGSVVFNELMYNPTVANGEYVELFNTSSNVSFNLSGWRINGLSYTFPEGAVILPRSFLLLAKKPDVLASIYGPNLPVFDGYDGNLDAEGETLSLIKPGATSAQDVVVDRVRYEASAPWPRQANGGGAAAQLIDAMQDNSRVGNWAGSSEWRYVTATGTANSSRVYVYLTGIGDVFIDDMKLVAGTVAESGTNLLRNGDFEVPLAGTWVVPTGNQQTHVSATNVHSGNGSLHLISTNPVVTVSAIFSQDITPALAVGQTYTMSFWYRPVPNTPNLITRMASGTLNYTIGTAPVLATPGAANAVASVLPEFPTLWLNEVLALNTDGITDGQGEREPWIEIYNAGTNVVSFNGLYLSSSYSNLTHWAFPAGASINPGEFKTIFADGEPGESTASEWHTSFRLGASNGVVALSRFVGNAPQIVDYLNYTALLANYGYGDFPDGQPFYRQQFFKPTPAHTNDATSAPIVVVGSPGTELEFAL